VAKDAEHAEGEIGRLRALAHPLRLQMLSLLTASAMSAAEVGRELDITHANASYHLRLLADTGLIVVEGEEQIRGGRAKRYRHPIDRATSRPGPEELASQVASMSAELVRRFGHRDSDPPAVFSDAELWVSPEVWREATELVTRASLLVHERAQRPRTKGTIKTNLTVAAFGMDA
jgi:DNA-binding transcriptional ArsR family regulator